MTLTAPRTAPRPRHRDFRVGVLIALVAAQTVACSASGRSRANTPAGGNVQVHPVADEKLAATVEGLLRDGRSTTEREGLLVGAVQRQLMHASQRFGARQRERGLAAVVGALFLVRRNEVRSEMFAGGGERTLAQATEVVAAAGDEGKSLALFDLRRSALPSGSRELADVDEHTRALRAWLDARLRRPDVGPNELNGTLERVAVARALLEPSSEALRQAQSATMRWAESGVAFQNQFRSEPQGRPKREEAVEGFRAVSSSAATLTALYLRDGDAAGALEALEQPALEQVTPPALIDRLRAASSRGDARDWRALLDAFTRPDSRDDDTSVDRDLLRAAAFGVAVEAYRRDTSSLEVAQLLAAELVALGLPEVAPVVMTDAARAHPDPRLLSGLFEAIGRVMVREEQDDDPASAHRTFAAATALLAIGDRPDLRGRVHPSPPQLRALAAGIDARAGELASAHALIDASLREAPTVEGYRTLAEVDRQMGDPKGALAALATVVRSPEAQSDRVLEAEARLLASDVARESGDGGRARQELEGALRAALAGRAAAMQAQGPTLARAERVLARVLDRSGDDAGAARASDRALTASKGDPRQLAATLLEALSRAYVSRDVPAARRAARAALSGNLRDEDLVYVGVWLRYLERETKTRTDGTAAEVLAGVHAGGAWPGRLAAWAEGKITDAELLQNAITPGQRTEAVFYSALARRVAGDDVSAARGLQQVARAAPLDLMEEQIARDLLAGSNRRVAGLPHTQTAP